MKTRKGHSHLESRSLVPSVNLDFDRERTHFSLSQAHSHESPLSHEERFLINTCYIELCAVRQFFPSMPARSLSLSPSSVSLARSLCQIPQFGTKALFLILK